MNGQTQMGEALAKLQSRIKLELPKMPEFTSVAGLDDSIQAKVAQVKEVRVNTKQALEYLDQVQVFLAAYNGDADALKVARNEVDEGIRKMGDYLDNVLACKDKSIRSTASTVYLEHCFSRRFEDCQSAARMLDDLVERDFLKPVPRTEPKSLMIRYERYQISQKLGLDANDQQKVAGAIEGFSRVLMKLEGQRRREKLENLAKQQTINYPQLRDGEEGVCLVHVPAEQYAGRDNQTRWRGGGDLLVRATERHILPLDSCGSIEGVIARMKKLQVRLERYTLSWNNPPGEGWESFNKIKRSVQTNLSLSDDEAREYVHKLQSLWRLMIRGKNAFENEEAIAEAKNDLKKKANISPAQFFGLNGGNEQPHGIALLSFSGAFRDKDESVFQPFFLAERGQDDNGEFVRIVEIPAHLENFLGFFVNEKYPTTDDFSKCPGLVRRLFQAIHGQEDMAMATAAESGHEPE